MGISLTGWLRREHDAFRVILDEMEETIKLDSPEVRLTALLGRLLPALSAHERVERDLLYPALLEHVKPMDPRLIDVFEEAHECVHEKTDALRSAIEDRGAGLGRLVAAADFISLLREHLEEEEQTLFPLAEQKVPKAALSDLGSRAAAVGRIGGGNP